MNVREAGHRDLFKCTDRCSFFYAIPSIINTASFQGSDASYSDFYYDMQQMSYIICCAHFALKVSPGKQSQGILVI